MNSFSHIFKNKKVLITGHTGFKGTWLTFWLTRLGAKVTGISKDIPTTPSLFEVLGLEKKITHIIEDIRNCKHIKDHIQRIQPDFIFHLAAQAIVSRSYADPIETITTNVVGTASILEALRDYNSDCYVVLVTSDKCYENLEWCWGYRENDTLGGKDIYSGSKAAAEILINSYFHSFFSQEICKVKFVSVRAGNVIGGGDWANDRLIPDIMRAWSEGKKVEIRNLQSTRPWQHVLEPLSGYLRCAEYLSKGLINSGESFNFGPNGTAECTVSDVLSGLASTWNLKAEELFYSGEKAFHEAKLLKLNCDKALNILKWSPTLNYSETIEFVGKWYYEYYKGKQTDLYKYTEDQLGIYESLALKRSSSWIQV